jgi:hypothetical protein
VSWVAWSVGSKNSANGVYSAAISKKVVSVSQTKLGYSATNQKTTPLVFAQIQTANWGKNSGLRYRSKAAKYVMLEIEEQTSKVEK